MKYIKLPGAYGDLLSDSLSPNGTIILVRCGLKWPSTKVATCHYFQSGVVGEKPGDELMKWSTTVNNFIESQKPSFAKMGDTITKDEHSMNWSALDLAVKYLKQNGSLQRNLMIILLNLQRSMDFRSNIWTIIIPKMPVPSSLI